MGMLLNIWRNGRLTVDELNKWFDNRKEMSDKLDELAEKRLELIIRGDIEGQQQVAEEFITLFKDYKRFVKQI